MDVNAGDSCDTCDGAFIQKHVRSPSPVEWQVVKTSLFPCSAPPPPSCSFSHLSCAKENV